MQQHSMAKEEIMQTIQNRRRFLATLTAAGAAGFIGPRNSATQEAPETTSITLAKPQIRSSTGFLSGLCVAPQFLAGEFLRADGFTDVHYLPSDAGINQAKAIAHGEIDLTLHFP